MDQIKETVEARQHAEEEVVRLRAIIRTFQNRPAMPSILQQQKPSPILLPITPQMRRPNINSPYDYQIATTRNTEACTPYYQHYPLKTHHMLLATTNSFNSLGPRMLSSPAPLDAYIPLLSPCFNLDLRAPFLSDHPADIPTMASDPPPMLDSDTINSKYRAPFLFDHSADISTMSSHASNPPPTLDSDTIESDYRAPFLFNHPADMPTMASNPPPMLDSNTIPWYMINNTC